MLAEGSQATLIASSRSGGAPLSSAVAFWIASGLRTRSVGPNRRQ